MLEVYNENLSDLLAEDAEESRKLQILTKGKSIIIPVSMSNLQIRMQTTLCFKGMKEIEVQSVEDLRMLIMVGEKQRTVASTVMNTNR